VTLTVSLEDEPATNRLATALAHALPDKPAGLVFLLQGELGAGKSTLARGMLRALGHDGTVPSPTYTLVEPYTFAEFTIYHIDLYRIASVDELEFLGWDEFADGLSLIEWPERVPGLSEQADLLIQLRYAGNGRLAELSALSGRGTAILGGIDLK
jgi:tRNA threonylcarbamoyladenosine biosynthesis protein TsaE